MQDATAAFRARYRAQVSPRYRAWAHGGFVFTTGGAACTWMLSHLDRLDTLTLLAALCGLLTFNAAVYFVHQQLGHRKRSWAAMFYARHTGDHHSFFSDRAMAFEEWRDWRVILFPPWLIVVFLLAFVAPATWLLMHWAPHPVAWAFGAHLLMGYLLYEAFHTCHHLPDGHPLTRLPWLRHMRRLHQLHHRRDLMHTHNFNIVLPLMDWLRGTLHWEPERPRHTPDVTRR